MLAPAPYDELDEASKRMLESEDVGEEEEEDDARLAEGLAASARSAAADGENEDDGDDAPQQVPDAWGRWRVLVLYSYLSALQSLLWMTFSSVPAASKAFLGVDDATLDLWLDWVRRQRARRRARARRGARATSPPCA